MPTDWTTIRVPRVLAEQLHALARKQLDDYVTGRRRELPGRNPTLPSLADVIAELLQEKLAHQERARKASKRRSHSNQCEGA